MAHVLTAPAPNAHEKKTAYLGMVIFVAGWTMMFGVMFFIYGALRISADAWPPLGLPLLPIALPTVSTACMVLSSLALEWGLHGVRHGKASRLAPGILLALALGIVFCGLQWKVGTDLYGVGLTFERGAYAAVLYGFSMIHAAHVLVGIPPLAFLVIRAYSGTYTEQSHLTPRLWAVYWHFVGVVWLAIYFLIFVL